MTHSIDWTPVTPDHVRTALADYDRLGAEEFLRTAGFGPTTTYDLVVDDRTYPPKAILGAAYADATGTRLEPGDFEGGRSGAVRVLTALGFDVRERAH
ncbi:hypothetical protein GCM10009840_02680 [Pseudolysinimonas kribbensis]|uniref:ScoMcrA-like N-terminal head domain-containing protein n=1 Tax=Pseudolysinimonas kribbensis TaxID=433641 RepID=A0ABQ6K1T2_9MICO|nr:hypothetical protein [Pseudolysinimonas kribbensis]GMA94560.1 hypothetical protein GCM10025881_13840 [Pseudolysinimonas kribbensis]